MAMRNLEKRLVAAEKSGQSEAKAVAEFLRDLFADEPGKAGLELTLASLAEMREWLGIFEAAALRDLKRDPPAPAVVMAGNLSEGYRVFGPYPDIESALVATEETPGFGAWAMSLESLGAVKAGETGSSR